jgi:cobalt/nickel transport system permease protein
MVVHIPDGFINGAASAGFGAVAAGGVGVAVRQTGRYLSERQVPLAGLAAAFVFAAQMFNFPVLSGMSGHLLGGVLAAVLVGPWAGYLIISVVLMVQGVFFADGGLSALGLNIINMGLIGAVGGYGVYRVVLRFLPKRPKSVSLAAGIAAFLSVPMAAMGFVIEFAIGGTVTVSLGAVLAAMLGTHILIGIGEGILTALIVGAVMSSRPDLVYGAPDYRGARTEELV